MRWEGSIVRKQGKWWLKHKRLGSQEWTLSPSDYRLTDLDGEAKAREQLRAVRDLWYAHEQAAGGEGPLTVEAWAKRWNGKRRAAGIDCVPEDEQRLRDHVAPLLGSTLLAEVRRAHAREVLDTLKMKGLAPRTVRHVMATAKAVFQAAVRAELLPTNPFDLEPGELPRKRDKDPTWREDASLTVEEVEQLITDRRVPEERRVLYAIEFLTGSRTGEAAALRWRRWDRDLAPLGRLTFDRAYSTRRRVERGTKTGATRKVPVHPALAAMLAAWKLSGFARYTGRRPEPDDLVVPSATGRCRSSGYSLKRFHRDLAALGLRPRRHYDSRRTFISIATDHGAPDSAVQWITHTPSGAYQGYKSPGWPALCAAVLCIPVKRESARKAK